MNVAYHLLLCIFNISLLIKFTYKVNFKQKLEVIITFTIYAILGLILVTALIDFILEIKSIFSKEEDNSDGKNTKKKQNKKHKSRKSKSKCLP